MDKVIFRYTVRCIELNTRYPMMLSMDIIVNNYNEGELIPIEIYENTLKANMERLGLTNHQPLIMNVAMFKG